MGIPAAVEGSVLVDPRRRRPLRALRDHVPHEITPDPRFRPHRPRSPLGRHTAFPPGAAAEARVPEFRGGHLDALESARPTSQLRATREPPMRVRLAAGCLYNRRNG